MSDGVSLNITKQSILKLVTDCNRNFGSRVLYLDSIENGIARIKLKMDNKRAVYLVIQNGRMQIIYGTAVKECNIVKYTELENFISMILIPYCIYGDKLYLDIIETGNGCKRVRDCSGLEAVLFTHSIVLGVKFGMIELTNAKLSKDGKVIVTDKSEFNGDCDSNVCIDNSW